MDNFDSKLKNIGFKSDPSLEQYLKSIDQFDLLQDEVANDKFKKMNCCREDLIKGHLKLVVKIAIDVFQFYVSKARAFDLMDLIQDGNETLLRCLDTFNEKQDVKFSTYLGNAIRNRLQDYIRANTGVLNLTKSAALRELHYNMGAICDMIDEGRDLEDIADAYGVTLQDLELVLNKHSFKQYDENNIPDLVDGLIDECQLGRIPADDDGDYVDFTSGHDEDYACSPDKTPEDQMIYNESIQNINRKLKTFRATLTPRQMFIFDNNMYGDKSLQELADELSTTRQNISQMKSRIMVKAIDYFDIDELKTFA